MSEFSGATWGTGWETSRFGQSVKVKKKGKSRKKKEEGSLAREEMFASYLESPTISVYITPGDKEYFLHKRILSRKCQYFATLLSSTFPSQEQVNNRIELSILPNSIEAFEILVEYLYKDTYQLDSDINYRCRIQAELYSLADRFLITDLKIFSLNGMRNDLNNMERHLFGPPSYYPLCVETVVLVVQVLYHTECESEGGTFRPIDFQAAESAAESATNIKTEDNYEEKVITEKSLTEFNDVAERSGIEVVVQEGEIPQDSQTDMKFQDPRKEMQILFATYVASHLEDLRRNENFLSIIEQGGDFAVDVINAVKNGPSLT